MVQSLDQARLRGDRADAGPRQAQREVLPWQQSWPGRYLPGAAGVQRQALPELRFEALSGDRSRVRGLHEDRGFRARAARAAARFREIAARDKPYFFLEDLAS